MMRPINETPKICSKEWVEAELRRSNQELGKLRGKIANEERERKAAQADLLKIRSENFHLRNKNEFLEGKIKELSKLPDQLEEVIRENKKLAKELNKRNGKENPYGLGTPSSKQVKKKNSTEENQQKRGGGEKGHKGHGRKDFTKEEADQSFTLDPPELFCGCEGEFYYHHRTYCVVDYTPAKMKKIFYEQSIPECSICGCRGSIKIPGIMPNHTYSNSTIANMLTEHYFYGHTAGGLEKRWGVNIGTFFNFAHNISDKLEPLFEEIVRDLRSCFIIHADETPWKKDGAGGYAWFFGNDKCKVFVFRHTRSSDVPISILGTEKLNGVLITDRYGGYVRLLKIARQYCLVHILRDVKKEEDDFPEDEEVKKFAADIKPLLSKAISLRNRKKELSEYFREAIELESKIMTICNQEANHPAVQHIQNIFREKTEKLFQWVKSPGIPADNNYAERALRPTVIARKISFGSQSEKGLKTREKLMTVLHTAHTRGWDPAEFLKEVLDTISDNPNTDISKLLTIEPHTTTSKQVA